MAGLERQRLYFAHPESRYFTLGKIGRDQVAGLRGAQRHDDEEVERWLGPNLGYEPAEALPVADASSLVERGECRLVPVCPSGSARTPNSLPRVR